MSTATTPLARPRTSNLSKHILWVALGLAGISVLIYTDFPLLHPSPDPYRAKLLRDIFLLIPHAVGGILATALGPFQFSTRFRQSHVGLHRLMGKVYILSVCVAAPTVLFIGRGFDFPLTFMGDLQAFLWLICTLLAFITARNRQIAVHRQWMVRSYAFTLNFILARLLNPIPAYLHMSDTGLALTLALLTASYFLIPEIAFNWRELTHRRA
jgi:uncharacterized membrane protein